MKPKKNDWIFERNNPASDMVRCPYGRSGVRKQLDLYARAAVTLYGIISREDLVEIFNEQNADQTTAEELYILLLPLVRKERRYNFFKDFVVNGVFFNNFEQVENWVMVQGDKPRYIPDREEFLEYAEGSYIRNEKFKELFDWFYDTFGYTRDSVALMSEIRSLVEFGNDLSEVSEAFTRHDIVFPDEASSIEFFERFLDATNNQRRWENKGHTPFELHEISLQQQENVIPLPMVQERVKIGRNDPCPCGSGRKYKKCCGLHKDSRSAQLSEDEVEVFYKTFYELLAYVNDRKGVLRKRIRMDSLEEITELEFKKVSDLVWAQPELIDAYLNEKRHSEETTEILRSWRTGFLKGSFIVLNYQKEYALFLGTLGEGDEATDRLFAVKGLTSPVSDILRRQVPVHVETVLLPFKGKIVYDTFMTTFEIGFGSGMKKMFEELHSNALSRGIITDLMQV